MIQASWFALYLWNDTIAIQDTHMYYEFDAAEVLAAWLDVSIACLAPWSSVWHNYSSIHPPASKDCITLPVCRLNQNNWYTAILHALPLRAPFGFVSACVRQIGTENGRDSWPGFLLSICTDPSVGAVFVQFCCSSRKTYSIQNRSSVQIICKPDTDNACLSI